MLWPAQRVCNKHDPSYYPRFKQWADEYFYCKHRDQRRGLGGIFFDDLNDRPQSEASNFCSMCEWGVCITLKADTLIFELGWAGVMCRPEIVRQTCASW